MLPSTLDHDLTSDNVLTKIDTNMICEAVSASGEPQRAVSRLELPAGMELEYSVESPDKGAESREAAAHDPVLLRVTLLMTPEVLMQLLTEDGNNQPVCTALNNHLHALCRNGAVFICHLFRDMTGQASSFPQADIGPFVHIVVNERSTTGGPVEEVPAHIWEKALMERLPTLATVASHAARVAEWESSFALRPGFVYGVSPSSFAQTARVGCKGRFLRIEETRAPPPTTPDACRRAAAASAAIMTRLQQVCPMLKRIRSIRCRPNAEARTAERLCSMLGEAGVLEETGAAQPHGDGSQVDALSSMLSANVLEGAREEW